MAHKTKIGGTNYGISGGKTKIGGTNYSVSKGRTLIGGTGYDIKFKYSEYVLRNGELNSDLGSVLYAWTRGMQYGAVQDAGGQYVQYGSVYSGNNQKLVYTETVSGGTGTRFINTSYGNSPNFYQVQGYLVVAKGDWTKIRLKVLPVSTGTIKCQIYGANTKSTSPPFYSGWTSIINTNISCNAEAVPLQNGGNYNYYAISLPSTTQVVEYLILEE